MTRCFLTITIAAIIATSCTGFLTRSPYDRISSDEFWHSEEDLELYSNGLIQDMLPSASEITRGSECADCFAMSIASDLLRADGNVSADNQTGWDESDWEKLRKINYMIDNLPKCKDCVNDATYRHYEGVARFWRAWFYFDMVKQFGAVPWYEHVINSKDIKELMKSRDNREKVMDKVLDDLQFASKNCSTEQEYTDGSVYINRWTALAFMSRVCLFEGTYRKYHDTDPSTLSAWHDRGTKFLRAAVEAAEEIISSGKYNLLEGNPEQVYRSLFTSECLKCEEVIFGREYSKAIGVMHDVTWQYFSPTKSTRISLVKEFMDTYLMRDGTPFTDRKDYKTLEYTEEFEDRDARMAQTVISPDYKRTSGGVTRSYSPDWNITITGYQPIKWCIDDDSDGVMSSGKSWNSLPIIRYAEILLNLAEAKAELGEMNEDIWNRTIAKLRMRAGVNSVIPTAPDQYMRNYFLDTDGKLDKWMLEIRRERGIELCLEGDLRWDDDMRWNLGKLSDSNIRKWRGIYVGGKSYSYSYTGKTDKEGNILPDFCISGSYSSSSIEVRNNGSDQSFSIDSEGYLVYEYAREWTSKKYLHPIPRSAIMRNPNLSQNPGW